MLAGELAFELDDGSVVLASWGGDPRVGRVEVSEVLLAGPGGGSAALGWVGVEGPGFEAVPCRGGGVVGSGLLEAVGFLVDGG